eukprot:5987093-Pyramimonas_sp.AAC.1
MGRFLALGARLGPVGSDRQGRPTAREAAGTPKGRPGCSLEYKNRNIYTYQFFVVSGAVAWLTHGATSPGTRYDGRVLSPPPAGVDGLVVPPPGGSR